MVNMHEVSLGSVACCSCHN